MEPYQSLFMSNSLQNREVAAQAKRRDFLVFGKTFAGQAKIHIEFNNIGYNSIIGRGWPFR